LAAIADSSVVPTRKASLSKTRADLCAWLKKNGYTYIEPQANFLMIDVGRDTRQFGREMAENGVAVGRPFPPLDHMLRVSIGTDQDMQKFKEVFPRVYGMKA
jgi:histidinol-phosphate/aromatic aminotransferase/cobyric acid decarboxylase-like protein